MDGLVRDDEGAIVDGDALCKVGHQSRSYQKEREGGHALV